MKISSSSKLPKQQPNVADGILLIGRKAIASNIKLIMRRMKTCAFFNDKSMCMNCLLRKCAFHVDIMCLNMWFRLIWNDFYFYFLVFWYIICKTVVYSGIAI